jgi:hypothetical protein
MIVRGLAAPSERGEDAVVLQHLNARHGIADP